MEKYLENKIVVVKPIPERENPNFVKLDPKHDGKFMFSGCKATLVLPMSQSRGGLVPFLNKEEQAFFEREMDMPMGALSFYKEVGNYWVTFRVTLDKNELRLDLSIPMDNLKWRLLLTYSDLIAPTWEDRNNKASYKWAMVDLKEEVKTIGKLHDLRTRAYAALDKIKDNKEELLKYLRLLGKMVSEQTDREYLYAELGNIIENTSVSSNSGSSIHDFLELVEDKNKNYKVILSDGLRSGLIYKKASKYFYDKDVIGIGEVQALNWIKDPENSEFVKFIEEKSKTLD